MLPLPSFTSFVLRAAFLSLLVISTSTNTNTNVNAFSVSTSTSTNTSTGTCSSSNGVIMHRCTALNVHASRNNNNNNDHEHEHEHENEHESEHENGRHSHMSRSSFISLAASSAVSTLFPLSIEKANALEDGVEQQGQGQEPSATSSTDTNTNTITIIEEQISIIETEPTKLRRTIEGCPKPTPGKPNNCVATSNIKQLENYSPPWTYEVSTDEAFARLKGLLTNDSTTTAYTIEDIDDENKYIKVNISRGLNAKDTMEFLIKGDDKVVVFKSTEVDGGNGLSDFGANKKRVDELRLKSGGVFRLMGEGLTADSFDGGRFGKRNGFGGQLKAFYGLQSGEGFQSVFEE